METSRRRGRDVDIPWRRVAATPRVADIPWRRVAATAATWTFRGDESPPRPRRGRSVKKSRRRGRDVDILWRRVAGAVRPKRLVTARRSTATRLPASARTPVVSSPSASPARRASIPSSPSSAPAIWSPPAIRTRHGADSSTGSSTGAARARLGTTSSSRRPGSRWCARRRSGTARQTLPPPLRESPSHSSTISARKRREAATPGALASRRARPTACWAAAASRLTALAYHLI